MRHKEPGGPKRRGPARSRERRPCLENKGLSAATAAAAHCCTPAELALRALYSRWCPIIPPASACHSQLCVPIPLLAARRCASLIPSAVRAGSQVHIPPLPVLHIRTSPLHESADRNSPEARTIADAAVCNPRAWPIFLTRSGAVHNAGRQETKGIPRRAAPRTPTMHNPN